MSRLKELTRARDEAWRKSEDLSRQIREYTLERRQAFDADLKRELEERFGQTLHSAREALGIANEAVEAEQEAVGLKSDAFPPIGLVMVEREFPNRWDRSPELRRLTGRRGVVEVITAASQHPANRSSYSHAERGSKVIRFLKKNGKPGLDYLPLRATWKLPHWIPEGEDPKTWAWPEGEPTITRAQVEGDEP